MSKVGGHYESVFSQEEEEKHKPSKKYNKDDYKDFTYHRFYMEGYSKPKTAT